MAMRVTLALASMMLGACSFSPSGGASGGADVGVVDGPVIDASPIDGPVIDGAAIDAQPIDAQPIDAPIDACATTCVGNVVQTCGVPVETCAYGCSEVGTAHCKQLIPSNGVTEADDLTGADVDIVLMANQLYTFNVTTGEIRRFPLDGNGAGTLVRAAGAGLDATTKIRYRAIAQTPPGGSMPTPELAIWGMKSLTVPATTVIRPLGVRAAVLVARDAITVSGELDVGGGRNQTATGTPAPEQPGPGGGRGGLDPAAGMGAQGCAPGGTGSRQTVNNMTRDTGGGGGGFATVGGKGGPASPMTDGGGSVVVIGTLPTACGQTNMMPLRGGSGGGCGQGGNNGGGGGGAVQLTSFTSIAVTGTLYAGGAGGDGTNGDGGGGAGGAGGGILLEAPAITVNSLASVTATGGGGGAGNSNTNAAENGQADGTPAAPTGNGGTGATGAGAGEVQATAGTGDVDGTGGGGGGAGIIHLRSLTPPTVAGTVIVRPAASTSTMATTP